MLTEAAEWGITHKKLQAAIIYVSFLFLLLIYKCNATARRSSTTCTTGSGWGKNKLGLGAQFDDEKIDSVPYRSI